MVWKNELVMANLVSVHCKQRSWAICGHLQNRSLFVQAPHRSKSLWLLIICILSLVCQLEGVWTCVCERAFAWTCMYAEKDPVLVCHWNRYLGAQLRLGSGFRRGGRGPGRSCLYYFWTFLCNISHCLFVLPSLAPPQSPLLPWLLSHFCLNVLVLNWWCVFCKGQSLFRTAYVLVISWERCLRVVCAASMTELFWVQVTTVSPPFILRLLQWACRRDVVFRVLERGLKAAWPTLPLSSRSFHAWRTIRALWMGWPKFWGSRVEGLFILVRWPLKASCLWARGRQKPV